MEIPTNTNETSSATDIALKIVPVVTALCIAVLSIWREVSKERHETTGHHLFRKNFNGEVKQRPVLRLGKTGWATVILALITCISGAWSVVRDKKSDDSKTAQLKSANATLQDVKGQNNGLKANLRELNDQNQELKMGLNNSKIEGIAATRESSHLLSLLEEKNARELEKRQLMTQMSLLSSIHEPSEGIFDFVLGNPVSTGYNVRFANPDVLEMAVPQNFSCWKVTQALGPLMKHIRWTDSEPVTVYGNLGWWEMSDPADKNKFGDHWDGAAFIRDKRQVDGAQDHGSPPASIGVWDYRHLIVRLSPQSSQDVLALSRGPDKDHISVEFFVKLRNLDNDKAQALENLKNGTQSIISSASAYYTVSGKVGLCKQTKLKLQTIEIDQNNFHMKYAGSEQPETVQCPDYVFHQKEQCD